MISHKLNLLVLLLTAFSLSLGTSGTNAAQDPDKIASESKPEATQTKLGDTEGKSTKTSAPTMPRFQQDDGGLLPSVGPVKKKDKVVETIDSFDFSKFESLSFREIIQLSQTNSNSVNKLYGTMPVGFPELQTAQMEQIKLLKEQNRRLAEILPRAAVEEFKKAPNEDPMVTNIVYASLKNLLDGNSATFGFDPVLAMEIAQMLIKNGDERPQIYYQAFRAAYALQDFERAEMMLKKVEEKGAERNATIDEKLNESKEKWNRELEFRRNDSAGAPLPQVQIETTAGVIIVELFENEAPGSVGNFINLVEKGFFNGHTFHLVRPGMFAQTGDPDGNGTGGPEYNIRCECYEENARHHFAGTLSMATSGKDTGGSQFFITHQPNSIFDGKYTAFGRVIKGMNNVYRLNTVNKTGLSPDDLEPSKIIKTTVLRKREGDYQPDKVPADSESKTSDADDATSNEIPLGTGGL